MDELLNDLCNYSPINFRSQKAQRVYYRCLQFGHTKIARKIYDKYAGVRSDMAVAIGYSLMASNNNL